jgi:hypothetical protein
MKTYYQLPVLLRGAFFSDAAISPLIRRLLRRAAALLAIPILGTMTLLTGCATLDAILATPTPVIPTQTPLPTPTFNWFPATETPTLQPGALTQQPAPSFRPNLGEIRLSDSFTRASLWDTATSDDGSAEVLNGQINLAAQSNVFMYSQRHNLTLDNFYVEITATPNLCRGADTYGVLIRANAVAYYRFAISCDGRVSAERNSVGKRLIMQSSVVSGDAPQGAPGQVRIGVWAVGTEMRLFLNDNFQFGVSDSNYDSGTVGVFVNSATNNPIIVSFSDLTIYDVEFLLPTQVPGP